MERVIATTTVAAALALTLFSGITTAQWVAAGIAIIGVPLFYRSVTRRARKDAIRYALQRLGDPEE